MGHAFETPLMNLAKLCWIDYASLHSHERLVKIFLGGVRLSSVMEILHF